MSATLTVVIVGVLTLAFWFLMECTRWGRVFYAVGGNETAAHLAGAPVKAYRVTAYMVSGSVASLGGVFVAARVGRGDVFAGSSLLLDSVAAALIGFAVLDIRNRPWPPVIAMTKTKITIAMSVLISGIFGLALTGTTEARSADDESGCHQPRSLPHSRAS
jgi:ABC-type uncharacterized transport system permease subunit